MLQTNKSFSRQDMTWPAGNPFRSWSGKIPNPYTNQSMAKMREQNELSLEEVQRESMRMLSVIDRVCVTNGIRYSLGYGSLIGAVRHKGFIPWDDDVDLIMTRPEYEKFVRLVNNDGVMRDNRLKFFAPELGNAFFNIARVCDMQRTRVRKYNQWNDEDIGMWISVFPIDSLPADNGALIRRQSKVCFQVCGARVPLLSGLARLSTFEPDLNFFRRGRW